MLIEVTHGRANEYKTCVLTYIIDLVVQRVIIKPPLATVRAASCDGRVHLFVCLSVAKLQNAIFSKTKQFKAMVSIDNL